MTTVAWILLFAAALLEVVWATALGRSDGFTRPGPALVGIVAAAASFALLTFALRSLPVGTAYAVWVGLGAVGVAVTGIALSGESAAPWRLVCLGLIVASVAGLKLIDG